NLKFMPAPVPRLRLLGQAPWKGGEWPAIHDMPLHLPSRAFPALCPIPAGLLSSCRLLCLRGLARSLRLFGLRCRLRLVFCLMLLENVLDMVRHIFSVGEHMAFALIRRCSALVHPCDRQAQCGILPIKGRHHRKSSPRRTFLFCERTYRGMESR